MGLIRAILLFFSFYGLSAFGGAIPLVDPPAKQAIDKGAALSFSFPTLSPEHKHVRALLENAMAYVSPHHQIFEKESGFIREGWNHDLGGMDLHPFTQLTAIGEQIELLSEIVVGHADSPYLSRAHALKLLKVTVKSLLKDQSDLLTASHGLLVDFPIFEGNRRVTPLAAHLYKADLTEKFGNEPGEKIWRALAAEGWIQPEKGDRVASIQRIGKLRTAAFENALAVFAKEPVKGQILKFLNERPVKAVYGDNANLSTSVAKAIGALLAPGYKDRPEMVDLRKKLESFLETQKAGYLSLYDPQVGLLRFGFEGKDSHYIGWGGQIGYHDYLINEFRNPTEFLVARFALPIESLANLGFQMKPYRIGDGGEFYVMAPYDGSAFEGTGLAVSFPDLKSFHWKTLLTDFVRAEADFCAGKKLGGFLSESYRHIGQYTGASGVPALSVNPNPRFTDASSLYTLGPSYNLDPDDVEKFLADHWEQIRKLETPHGPWEGYNYSIEKTIEVQTSAHTLSLILGFLGTGADNMERYLNSKDLREEVDKLYESGENFDWLSASVQIGADEKVGEKRFLNQLQVDGAVNNLSFQNDRPVNISDGTLTLHYQTERATPSEIVFVPFGDGPRGTQEKLISLQLKVTKPEEVGKIEVPLPATPGLARIGKILLRFKSGDGPSKLKILRLSVEQAGQATAPVDPNVH